LTNINEAVLHTSFDVFVGSEDDVTSSFVRNYLNLFTYHPIKNGVSME